MNDRPIGLIQRAAERLRSQRPEIAIVPPKDELLPEAPARHDAPAPIGAQPLPPPPPESRDVETSRISREVKIDRQRLAKSGVIFTNTERSRVAEEFRIIVRQILAKAQGMANEPGQSRLIMITSSRPREGKTFTSINIALAIASQRDYRVLAMDCDVERQSMT